MTVDVAIPEITADVVAPDVPVEPDIWIFDSGPDVPFVECAEGEGCFLDPCSENDTCQSGWCVEHMGDGVCTQLCTEECPPGWSCKPVGAGGPDLSYICVSGHANLCRPCSSGADCKGVGGAEDVCLDYGDEGSFCGGGCTANEECPWGFSCLTTVTVDGISTLQCVADAGVCPCTAKSIELSLFTPCTMENEFGICGGKRVCTAEGITDCDAMVPAAEECNGIDEDCDGSIDEPNEFEGKFVPLCDDENPCTDDACLGAEGCSYTALTEGECLDGDACTIGDHCEAGVCIGAPIDCDDDNPCTDDACDGLGGCEYTANFAKCDDGDPCTVSNTCGKGVCKAGGVKDCGDGNGCTDDSCLSGKGCKHAPNDNNNCDDGNFCTSGDLCKNGECLGKLTNPCDDGNACTKDSCTAKQACVHVNTTGGVCEDGDACTLKDLCKTGQCISGTGKECVDSQQCTVNGCDAKTGKCMFSSLSDGDCDDGNLCTLNDKCLEGKCKAGTPPPCGDGNPCTADNCEPTNGKCLHNSLSAGSACDDGNLCTKGSKCVDNKCVGAPKSCNDKLPCTLDTCDPGNGKCGHQKLLDGSPCGFGASCKNGACVK